LHLLLAIAACADDLVILPPLAVVGAVGLGTAVHAAIYLLLSAHCEPPFSLLSVHNYGII